jgi:hypothetical protein
MLNFFRSILVSALLLPLLLVAAATGLAFYVLEDKPWVEQNVPVDYATVAAGKSLLKRIKIQVESTGDRGTTLLFTEDELRYLAQMASHTFPRLHTDLYLDSTGVNSRMSVKMPANPFGAYLNLGVQIGQSSAGIGIDRFSIGPLDVSGRWLLPLMARLADVLLKDKQASALLASVREFRIEGKTALLSVVPPPDAKAQFKHAVRTLQASRLPPGEQERVVHYYDVLVAIAAGQGNRQRHSLDVYLVPLMAEAAKRGGASSAVAENRAAIWATIIYFSNGAFETLVGKLVSTRRPLVRAPSGVTLGGREDLMLHFLYSAGITLATQQGIGIAAGEFKELLDSGNGGSGFSFADLAADRAGIQFVTVATASEATARQLQEMLVAGNSEERFFPDVSGLVEGLSEEQFRQQYGSTESERYRKQVILIDQLIARLPVY